MLDGLLDPRPLLGTSCTALPLMGATCAALPLRSPLEYSFHLFQTLSLSLVRRTYWSTWSSLDTSRIVFFPGLPSKTGNMPRWRLFEQATLFCNCSSMTLFLQRNCLSEDFCHPLECFRGLLETLISNTFIHSS